MKIAHISPTYFSKESVVGGGEKYIIYLAKAIDKAAKEQALTVTQTLFAFSETAFSYEIDKDINGQILVGEAWNPHSLTAAPIRDAIRDLDVVFVHQCFHPFGLFIAAQAKLSGKIVVGMDHGGGEHRSVYNSPEIGYIFDLFIAYSEFAAASYHDVFGKVELVRGPVDTDYFYPVSVEKQVKTVLMLGRIMPHKGHDVVVRALPDNLKLKIIGSRYNEDYWSYIEGLIGRKDVSIIEGLSDDEVRNELRSAGLVVHPSTHVDYRGTHYAKPELLGLAPLEALACGTGVIVSGAGSLPELTIVNGCLSYQSEDELGRMLSAYSSGALAFPSPQEIYTSVVENFGLSQFGAKVLKSLKETVQ